MARHAKQGKPAHPESSVWRPSRRDVLCVGIAGLVATVPLARRRPLTLVRRNVVTMGTIAQFAVAHRDPARAHAAIAAAIRELYHVDDTMSRFKSTSDIGRTNLLARYSPVPVGEDTMQVLAESLRFAEESNGLFDPCLGGAIRLWDVNHRREPPSSREVGRFANRRLYRFLEVSRHHGQPVVLFHDRDVSVDLGGIAKGYAVDRAVAALRDQGVEHALVGAAGDIYALGHSPSGDPWHVGIQSPDNPDALAGSLYLSDEAVSTSGDYRQFFTHHNRRYHHIIDAVSAEPRRTSQHCLTIVADTCMVADAAATLAFGVHQREAGRVLASHGARIVHAG